MCDVNVVSGGWRLLSHSINKYILSFFMYFYSLSSRNVLSHCVFYYGLMNFFGRSVGVVHSRTPTMELVNEFLCIEITKNAVRN
jgi:hypothetical protein